MSPKTFRAKFLCFKCLCAHPDLCHPPMGALPSAPHSAFSSAEPSFARPNAHRPRSGGDGSGGEGGERGNAGEQAVHEDCRKFTFSHILRLARCGGSAKKEFDSDKGSLIRSGGSCDVEIINNM